MEFPRSFLCMCIIVGFCFVLISVLYKSRLYYTCIHTACSFASYYNVSLFPFQQIRFCNITLKPMLHSKLVFPSLVCHNLLCLALGPLKVIFFSQYKKHRTGTIDLNELGIKQNEKYQHLKTKLLKDLKILTKLSPGVLENYQNLIGDIHQLDHLKILIVFLFFNPMFNLMIFSLIQVAAS